MVSPDTPAPITLTSRPCALSAASSLAGNASRASSPRPAVKLSPKTTMRLVSAHAGAAGKSTEIPKISAALTIHAESPYRWGMPVPENSFIGAFP